MEIDALQNLLNEVSSISRKYEEAAKVTGENFNIFTILHLESNETKLHSRLIGDLLNPKGLHGQGSKFLKLFFEVILLKESHNESELSNTKIFIEEDIGFIPQDYSKGGRIDIVIKPARNREVVIENKIYAVDQPKQLWRYKQNYPSSSIYYLTLYGKKPDLVSKHELTDTDFTCISYQNHIISWLELCKKEVGQLPLIRETLTQYIHLIKKLTNQSTNVKMEKEIISNIVNSSENIKSAFLISGSFQEIKTNLFNKLHEQLAVLANHNNLELDFEINVNEKWKGFYFYNSSLIQDNICIGFEFDNYVNDMYYGISKYDLDKPVNKYFNENIKTKLAQLTGLIKSEEKWPCWLPSEKLRYWGVDEYSKIPDGALSKIVFEDATKIITALKEIEPARYKFELNTSI